MTFDQTALHQLEKLEKKALESRSITGRSRSTVTVQLELETCTVDNVTSLIVTKVLPIIHTNCDGKVSLMCVHMVGNNPETYSRRIATPEDVEAF